MLRQNAERLGRRSAAAVEYRAGERRSGDRRSADRRLGDRRQMQALVVEELCPRECSLAPAEGLDLDIRRLAAENEASLDELYSDSAARAPAEPYFQPPRRFP